MIEIIKSYCWWPKLANDIKDFVNKCNACQYYNKDKPAPMHVIEPNESVPWNSISIDFMGPSHRLQGKTFLSVIDWYSRYPFIFEIKKCDAKNVIHKLNDLFAMTGIPKRIISDNGSVFRSEDIKEFLLN